MLRHNADDQFDVGYIANITNEEKLMVGWHVGAHTVGAGQTPSRSLFAGKFVQNAQFTRITNVNDQAGDFDTGSNLSILGSGGVESMKVQDGAVFYETDTNKSYVLSGTTWSEL